MVDGLRRIGTGTRDVLFMMQIDFEDTDVCGVTARSHLDVEDLK